ncbi:C40 family peptidase [Nonomuraea sediminis]|uniref:C40 family peptidase n=1 Tax=Nonomuraea sediminis TaxID=2835864 RepID=UPI001BDC10B4|nr:C40 family peptidase [Nonomuraea sediminis]
MLAWTLAITLSAFPGGVVAAEPKPTIAQAKAKLRKLNERADAVVERYNQAGERYKAAKKKYGELNADVTRTGATAEALRGDLVRMALNSYQYGDPTGWGGLMAQSSPEATLGSMASVELMARVKQQRLQAYEDTTRDLRQRFAKAKAALGEADRARDAVSDEKKKVEQLVSQQVELLRRLGAYNPGDPDSKGVEYTGSASGNTRLALQFAFAQIGKPYQWGGTGPNSFDCSGFTQAAWRLGGVELPRTTYQQWAWGAQRRVPLNALQPGDLLFSKGLGHMGMYVGDGKMIHSPQTGDVVKVSTLDGYWRGRLLGAVRP